MIVSVRDPHNCEAKVISADASDPSMFNLVRVDTGVSLKVIGRILFPSSLKKGVKVMVLPGERSGDHAWKVGTIHSIDEESQKVLITINTMPILLNSNFVTKYED